MSLLELALLLLIAGVCGGIARSLAGQARGGCLVSVALGFVGALLGSWLARTLGLPEILAVSLAGKSFPIVWSIIGAAIFAALLGLISGRGRRPMWGWRKRRFWD